MEDYFDMPSKSRPRCASKGKSLDILGPSNAGSGEVVTVRQQQPLGLGHAVWCARHVVGDEPFAVLLPDELMYGRPNCLAQMVDAYSRVGGNIVAALEVPDSETHKYGVIDPGATDGRLTEIRGMVEKPAPGTAPSNLMLPGRYILQPEVMRELDAQEAGAGGEIQLTDAMAKLIGRQPFNAYRFEGERYDCGSASRIRDRQPGDGAGPRRRRATHPRLSSRCRPRPTASPSIRAGGARPRWRAAGHAAHQRRLRVRPRARRASHCRRAAA